MSDTPNVVLIVPHDTGRNISPCGYPTFNTPTMERLAAEGLVFDNCFCTAPLCSPSRAGLTTGLTPHQAGTMGLVGGDQTGMWDLAEGMMHASHYFRQAGYATALLNGCHEARFWENRMGFDNLERDGHEVWTAKENSLLYVDELMDRWFETLDRDKPFYIQVGSHETHLAWDAHNTPPDDSRGVWIPPYLKESDELREDMKKFQGAVKRFDEGVGRIEACIERHGFTDNTIFVVMPDHGIDVPCAKGTFYDPGIEVFLVMRYPNGKWKGGHVYKQMLSNVDVLPTLLDACGIDIPAEFVGKSFLPLIRGEAYDENEYVFAEKTFHDTYEPTRCIRSKRYKFIKFLDVECINDPRIGALQKLHMYSRPLFRRNSEELYDLENDPLEMNNVADDPAYAQVRGEMKTQLAQWMVDTDDPLLQGPVPSPLYRKNIAELKALVSDK